MQRDPIPLPIVFMDDDAAELEMQREAEQTLAGLGECQFVVMAEEASRDC